MHYIGYGQTMIAVFDTQDETIAEFSATPILEARCPRCEGMVSETMTRCKNNVGDGRPCNLAVVWFNSRKWKAVAGGLSPKAVIETIRLRPWCPAEREALALLKAQVWASGTVSKLNKLRDLSYPIQLTDKLRSERVLKSALALPTKKAQQNYWLTIAISELCQPESEVYDEVGDEFMEEF